MGQKYFVNRMLFSHVLNEMLFYTSISCHVITMKDDLEFYFIQIYF